MRALILAAVLVSGAAIAQPEPQADNTPADAGDQLVGLFGAACMHFAGNAQAVRDFLRQQHAPELSGQARDAFLAGRQGVVFDTSYKTVRLALVSLDDGGCEAVAEQADGPRVISVLQQAAAENQVPLQNLGVQSDKQRQGVTQTAFSLTLAGRPMHILAVTAQAAPQASLILVPR